MAGLTFPNTTFAYSELSPASLHHLMIVFTFSLKSFMASLKAKMVKGEVVVVELGIVNKVKNLFMVSSLKIFHSTP